LSLNKEKNMGSNFAVKENGSANGTSASFKTISELLEVYDLSPLVALEWVWGKPNLRKILIKRAWRDIVKSEYGKIGAAARNEKLTDEQREESARYASLARWKKDSHTAFIARIRSGAPVEGISGVDDSDIPSF
jgi:hypothetical protein